MAIPIGWFLSDAIFVPAGTWHNVINIGRMPLKISSVYAPPNHRKGTVHRTKEEAERAEYYDPVIAYG